jgi:hypothetical protein
MLSWLYLKIQKSIILCCQLNVYIFTYVSSGNKSVPTFSIIFDTRGFSAMENISDGIIKFELQGVPLLGEGDG